MTGRRRVAPRAQSGRRHMYSLFAGWLHQVPPYCLVAEWRCAPSNLAAPHGEAHRAGYHGVMATLQAGYAYVKVDSLCLGPPGVTLPATGPGCTFISWFKTRCLLRPAPRALIPRRSSCQDRSWSPGLGSSLCRTNKLLSRILCWV